MIIDILEGTDRNSTIIKQMLADAVRAAKPIWLGFMCGDNEVHSRLAIYFDMVSPDYYVNINTVDTDPAPAAKFVDRCCLAKEKSGPPFITGPLTQARYLTVGDILRTPEGEIKFNGKLPE